MVCILPTGAHLPLLVPTKHLSYSSLRALQDGLMEWLSGPMFQTVGFVNKMSLSTTAGLPWRTNPVNLTEWSNLNII